MSFLNPIFLLALLAAGIPLMIHLLNLRRPKKIRFSTLAFFQELKKSTIRRIRIKRWLLLIMRVMAVACLALVLARPFLPPGLSIGENVQAPSLNAIIIDNSISMDRVGSKGPLIDYAKEVASGIADASKDNDRFILQVSNGDAVYPAIINHTNLNNALAEIETRSSGNYLAKRIEDLSSFMEESPYEQKKLFFITDAQNSQLSSLEDLEDFDDRISIVDVGDVTVQNTVISEASITSRMIGAGLPVQLNVRLTNMGEAPAINQFLSLEYNEQPLGQYSVSLQPGEEKSYSFEVNPDASGNSTGRIWIEGDEFISDNDYYFSLEIPDQRSILWINGKEAGRTNDISYTKLMLDVAGENDVQFSYDEIGPGEITSADLNRYDAYILDALTTVPEFLFSELQQQVQSGKGLIFLPSENGSIQNYNDFMAQFSAGRWAGIAGDYASFRSVATADQLLDEHPAFAGLFERREGETLQFSRPSVYYYFRFQPAGSANAFDLLKLNNGDPLVHEKKFGSGKLILSAIGNDPGWSNFPVQELFAPFYYRLSLYAASSEEGGLNEHVLGEPFVRTGNYDPSSTTIQVNEQSIKPESRIVNNGAEISYSGQEWSSGFVEIRDDNNSKWVALNISPEESDFKEYSEQENTVQLNELDLSFVDAGRLNDTELISAIQATGFGREVWQWFLIAGMMFLIAESLISSLYKAEN